MSNPDGWKKSPFTRRWTKASLICIVTCALGACGGSDPAGSAGNANSSATTLGSIFTGIENAASNAQIQSSQPVVRAVYLGGGTDSRSDQSIVPNDSLTKVPRLAARVQADRKCARRGERNYDTAAHFGTSTKERLRREVCDEGPLAPDQWPLVTSR
jgi:hypothetical protein